MVMADAYSAGTLSYVLSCVVVTLSFSYQILPSDAFSFPPSSIAFSSAACATFIARHIHTHANTHPHFLSGISSSRYSLPPFLPLSLPPSIPSPSCTHVHLYHHLISFSLSNHQK